jgi:glycosyltransferase involved in cell wall biosynthesis
MITVLIATRNRASSLVSTLESFCNLQSPSGGWKLVVIDNGSTDASQRAVDSFTARLPLTRIFEERLGKNKALNAGLKLLEGDLAVFTDDDVVPARDWLIRMRAAADTQTSFSIFGGTISPRWGAPPPEWVHWVDLGAVFSVTDPLLNDGPAIRGSFFGPNLAVRAEIFKQGILFDESIGPRGTDYPMGSETELVHRLRRLGHKTWHVQGAHVEHCIEADHLDVRWVLRRAIRFGRGQYRLNRLLDPSSARIPLIVIPRMLRRAVRIALGPVASSSEEVFRARWELNCLWGQAVEARNSFRRPDFRGPAGDTKK